MARASRRSCVLLCVTGCSWAYFARLFARTTASVPEPIALEEDLLRTLAHLLRRHGTRPRSVSLTSPAVAIARQRLDEAPEVSATLAELAALSGVSRFQLLRGFARETGVTPHAYLLQRRVRLARQLLIAGCAPAEAAQDAGFADQSPHDPSLPPPVWRHPRPLPGGPCLKTGLQSCSRHPRLPWKEYPERERATAHGWLCSWL